MNTTEIPTYVEFNGIPGTGKTTLTSALIDKLEEQNYKIFDLNEVYFYQEEMKKSNIITSIKAIIFNPGISLKAFELLYKSKVNGEKIKYLIKILKLHYQLKKVLKNNLDLDFIILDEGIIQYLLAYVHLDQNIDINTLSSLLNSITDSIPHINVFNCDLNIDIVTSRVKNRNIEGHRFDSMSETNLENNLRINYANLKKIRNLIDDNIITKNIDMSLEFHYNLDFILGLLICD